MRVSARVGDRALGCRQRGPARLDARSSPRRVDLLHGRVDVATTLAEVRGHLIENPPKTRARRRSVPIRASSSRRSIGTCPSCPARLPASCSRRPPVGRFGRPGGVSASGTREFARRVSSRSVLMICGTPRWRYGSKLARARPRSPPGPVTRQSLPCLTATGISCLVRWIASTLPLTVSPAQTGT